MVLLVGTHITRKSPCHIITMAMGWTEYVLTDEEVLLKDERGTAKTEESRSSRHVRSSDPLLVPAGTVDGLK